MKPRVLMVTRIPFWLLGAGERMRLLAMVWVLGSKTELTVLFLGVMSDQDVLRLSQLRVNAAVLQMGPVVTQMDVEAAEREAFHRLCSTQTIDVCIFERIALHALLEVLPSGVRSVLDTHDLESANIESRRSQGHQVEDSLTLAGELAMFSKYDRVLLIQPEDHALVSAHLGELAMLVPHPVSFPKVPVDPDSRRLGLVASAWAANLHGLDWFADQVWPQLASIPAQMHLFGWIGNQWRPNYSAFERHGYVADFKLAWGMVDVAINPVRWGSGLKIKTVEALGHGLPLVTTSEGARGLAAAAGQAFVVADEPDAFANACKWLLNDPQARRVLGESAYAFARQHFSPKACFGELMQWIGA